MEKIRVKIGIPRALLYYKYKELWKTFFEKLGCEVVLSPKTTKEMLKDGINRSIDESCLSVKVYMGHVNSLRGKVDYIFVPRIASFGKNEETCTKFHGIYDIVKNTFDDIKLLEYNLDVNKGKPEVNGFLKLGLNFSKNPLKVYRAYKKAKEAQQFSDKMEGLQQERLLREHELKILMVSHPYNMHDELIGQPIVRHLKRLGVFTVDASLADERYSRAASKKISPNLYWTYNKELIGSIEYYRGKVDGIIFLEAFPCGPDSLVVEMCQRKIKGIPAMTIVMDELQGEAGLHTRLESFVDIITMRKQEDKII